MPRGPYDTTGVAKPSCPKPPKGKCPQLPTCLHELRTALAMMISTADRNKRNSWDDGAVELCFLLFWDGSEKY
ncbi:hypothetical protein HZ326_4595 [Fusarium oxysporum f. sp. albedinis]|nr:hypothetical protein HZ326_4595 [Fusarium oxysporum f. sp. albedinis]